MSTHRSHSQQTPLSPDDDLFSGDWLATQGLKRGVKRLAHSDHPQAAGGTTVIPTGALAPTALVSKEYGTRDWVDVTSTKEIRLPLPPPAGLSRIASPNFESWLENIQSVSALEHPSESRLRAARDARLLTAIRRCHSAHKNHMRRLEDARALAIQILCSPFVRRISAAQGVELHMRADREVDERLVAGSGGDSDPAWSDGDSNISVSSESASAHGPVSTSDDTNISTESHKSPRSVIVLTSDDDEDDYEDANPGEKRARRALGTPRDEGRRQRIDGS